MNEPPTDAFEADLQRRKPAAPPAEFMARLIAANPPAAPEPPPVARTTALLALWRSLRWWLAPAMACLLGLLVFVQTRHEVHFSVPLPAETAEAPAVKADSIHMDSELVSTFDTVARLPSGEPVRFRCREWVDEVKLRDHTRGVVVERRTPRVEVVPVRFETY